MGKRRKDEAHDIGDSKPGTVGDSEGTIHDRRGAPSFDPANAEVPGESTKQTTQQNETNDSTESESDNGEQESQSTRMKYAKNYGESWPEERQQRFLREHEMSAKEMGWKLTE